MTRLEALTALEAKVVDGSVGIADWEDTLAVIDFGLGWAAYMGSLDAAKVLHEAVLPEWRVENIAQQGNLMWWVTIHRPVVGDSDGEIVRNGVTVSTFDQPDPARSWLIAIIRALIAMEGD